MGRISIWMVFVFLVGACSFISKRLDNREKQEATSTVGEKATSGDAQLTQLRIRDFERRLKSQREKELYAKLLPWFRNEDERLEYLELETHHDRQEWIQDNNIWTRAKSPSGEMQNLMQTGDIAIGMPMDYVTKSWGDPLMREVSGNRLFRNEKWHYARSVSTQDGFKQEKRTVYFEGGKVVGWETE